MPAQQRVPQSPAPEPPGEDVDASLGRRGGIGNAERLERLHGGKPAPQEGKLGEFGKLFTGLDGAGSADAPAFMLARAAGNFAESAVADVDRGEDGGGKASTPPPAGSPAPAAPPTGPKAGTAAAGIYEKHKPLVGKLSSQLTPAQVVDLEEFQANWQKNKGRYEAVAAKTGVPAALIAAIHWRESTGNFNTYLHQGDPLGKKARHVPRNIPIFTVWEDAAVHALTMSDKAQVRDDLGMNKDTTDGASMATYAEFYNGLGYHNKKRQSPYVYSGTDNYKGGKYIRDGVFSATAKDQQLGVMAMVSSINGMDQRVKKQPARGAAGWDSLVGGRTVQKGAKGPLIKELQTRLAAAGYPCGDKGVFDAAVLKAVKAFQKDHKLEEDGIVGSEVATQLVTPVPKAIEAPQDPAPAQGPAPAGAPGP